MFAIDCPATLAITHGLSTAYTSNIFALLRLRAPQEAGPEASDAPSGS